MVDAQIALGVLLGLTQRFTRSEPLDTLLEAVTEAALRLLPAEHTSIRVLNDAGDELLCGARSGVGAEDVPMRFQPGYGIVGWVAEHGWVANVPDTQVDERFAEGAGQTFAIRSLLAVPILSAGRVVAVLSASAASPGAFAPEDEALALLLANATAPLIDRARLERLALVDELTGAYSDRHLLPRLREELERAQGAHDAVSLLMVDLDHLGALNRAHDFAAGNAAIRQVAERLRCALSPRHTLVRRGGGTFVVILPGLDGQAAGDVAERLRAAVSSSPVSLSEELAVTQHVSVGVATWDGVERSIRLLERADAALRRAKEKGRDQVVCARPDAPKEPHSPP